MQGYRTGAMGFCDVESVLLVAPGLPVPFGLSPGAPCLPPYPQDLAKVASLEATLQEQFLGKNPSS
jgi:hypothetical protein